MSLEYPVGPQLILAALIKVTVQHIYTYMCTFYCLYCISYTVHLSSLAFIQFLYDIVFIRIFIVQLVTDQLLLIIAIRVHYPNL